ncbi:MAG: chromate efflux transporter [Chthoniobacteraceae bacterium]
MNSPAPHRGELGRVAWLFLKLGCTAFGGPAAHVAIMEHEVVRERGWLTHAEFLDLLGATNLIPGPNSTEMAIHIGHRRAGWPGLVVAGCCFILPATIIVGVIAWAYVKFGVLPEVTRILHGVKPVIVAVIIQALWSLARTAIKTRWLATLGIAALALNAVGVNELAVLFGTGLVMAIPRLTRRSAGASALGLIPFFTTAAPAASVAAPFSVGALFWFFMKVGSVLFGSGYVLLAFLRADLVERWHWLTETQLLDAIAVGQFTPGPVFTSATFIGYILGGPPAALAATVGIFLPAFVFIAISGPLVPKLRASPVAGAFLDGVNVASLALMTVVTWQLARAALVDWRTLALATATAFLLLKYRVNSAWLVLGGAIAGWFW